ICAAMNGTFTFQPLLLVTALAAGMVSFASPCVLPLVPAYLGFITGRSAEELKSAHGSARVQVITQGLAFVAGLAVMFALLGAAGRQGQRARPGAAAEPAMAVADRRRGCRDLRPADAGRAADPAAGTYVSHRGRDAECAAQPPRRIRHGRGVRRRLDAMRRPI